MEKQRQNGKSDRIRKKLMQGVLGCLFAMGIMLLMPGTGMKVQAAYTPSTTTIQGITYRLYTSTCWAESYNASVAGTEVHIPATIEDSGSTYQVTKIYDSAFAGSSLRKITLEEGLTTINQYAFQKTQLTEIEIPASVTIIWNRVFDGCTSLKKIRFRGTTPPLALDYQAFAGINGPITIQIPESADKAAWEKALQKTCLAFAQYTIQIGTPSSDSDSSSDSSPSPAKQGSEEASLEAVEEEPVNRIPEHVCQYEWETVREAGAGQDGLEQYLCKLCGSVQSTLTIPASQYQVQELYTKVTAAAEGETVTYDMGQIHTVCDKLFTKLQERSDVTLILTYRYKGQDYQTTFPAGADYTELIEDEEQFYGMLGLKGRCGIVTE